MKQPLALTFGVSGFFLILGSAGSYEVDSISFPGLFLLVCIGFGLIGLGFLIARSK